MGRNSSDGSCGACGDAEALVVVPVRRIVPVAVSAPGVPGGVVKATAPDAPVRALRPLPPRFVALFGENTSSQLRPPA